MSAFRARLFTSLAPVLLAVTLSAGQQGPPAAPPKGEDVKPSFADTDPIPEPLRQETFRLVWETVRDKYFDPTMAGVDWTAIRTRYAGQVAATAASGDFHRLLNRMVRELPVTHLGVSPPGRHSVTSANLMVPDTLELRANDEAVLVFSVTTDSPAWRAGLRPGFQVVAIDSTVLARPAAVSLARLRQLAETRRLLAGPAASAVQMRVRNGEHREQVLTLARTVPFKQQASLGHAVISTSRVRPRIAYLSFDGWAVTLGAKLEPLLADLADSDALIIDLRQNRGGTGSGVNRLAKFLLAEPGLIAVMTPRTGERREWRHEGSGAAAYRGKVAVIIDETSGSASEVFAALMQERHRAVIVGHTSCGGVLNSTDVELPTGGVLVYPHSDMTTGSGRHIEGTGVIPDVKVELRREDLLKGKDTVLEMAIRALQSGA